MAKNRTLIESFRTIVFGSAKDLFQEYGKPILKGATEGFITAQAIQQRNRAQQQRVKEVPPDFRRLPVGDIGVGTPPTGGYTLRVASIGDSDVSLWPMYALALVQQSKDTNVFVEDNFKVQHPGKKIKKAPEYRRSQRSLA